jgi:hypothetical protein
MRKLPHPISFKEALLPHDNQKNFLQTEQAFSPSALVFFSSCHNSYYGSRAAADLLERVLYMALMVFGVVRQQPPTREAPTSHHLSTYDTKSSSETPVCCCNKIKAEGSVVMDYTRMRSRMYFQIFFAFGLKKSERKTGSRS